MPKTEFGKACVALTLVLMLVQFAPIYDYWNNNGVGTHAEIVLDAIVWYCIFIFSEITISYSLWKLSQWLTKPPEYMDPFHKVHPPLRKYK